VREGVRRGEVAVNAADGWLHNIGGRAYVVVPDCFEAFAAVDGVRWKTVKNRVARLRLHALRRSASGGVDAYRAQFPDGHRVTGMLFPGEMVWGVDEPPVGHAVLGRRPDPARGQAVPDGAATAALGRCAP